MAASEENQEANCPQEVHEDLSTFIVAPDGKQIEVNVTDVAVAFHEAATLWRQMLAAWLYRASRCRPAMWT